MSELTSNDPPPAPFFPTEGKLEFNDFTAEWDKTNAIFTGPEIAHHDAFVSLRITSPMRQPLLAWLQKGPPEPEDL